MNKYRIVRMVHNCTIDVEEWTLGQWFDVKYLPFYMKESVNRSGEIKCGFYSVEPQHTDDAERLVEEALS
jgi:hypothetical protein